MKEITVFSCGDSLDISTWSNVPYLFTKTLEEKGIKVNRVDISPSKPINRIFNSSSYIFCKRLLHLKACPEFHRTFLHRMIIYHRIKRATKLYPHSELNLFLSFAFLNPFSHKPNVLWCDWTDAIVIERLGRTPKWYERRSLKHERKVIRQADLVYTMFPECKRQMERMYDREILYLNRNVVNTVYNQAFSIEDVARQREQSNILLFIGSNLYHHAALELIQAFERLKKTFPLLECHIIGIDYWQLFHTAIPNGVICHGYLHKDIKQECDLYYSLLLKAKVLVNSSAKWGGYSSIVEGMFYGCPVIVAPYADFVSSFGMRISFGYYFDSQRDSLEILLGQLINNKKYKELCMAAHNAVHDWTWANYMDVFCHSLSLNLKDDKN